MSKINNLLNFSDFEKNWKAEQQKKTKRTEVGKDVIKEAKKKWTDQERVLDGVDNILKGYFAYAKKPKFKYNKRGFPTEVTFMVDENDYKLDWSEEPLKTDYQSELVALKHVYEVELNFVDKEKIDDNYYMTFTIKYRKLPDPKRLSKWRKEVGIPKEYPTPDDFNDDYYDDIDDEKIDREAAVRAEMEEFESFKMNETRKGEVVRINRSMVERTIKGMRNLIKHAKKTDKSDNLNFDGFIKKLEEYLKDLMDILDMKIWGGNDMGKQNKIL